ncbi:MAG: hypothetical protein ACE5HZ_04020 [Fidelibacterota bacterium]
MKKVLSSLAIAGFITACYEDAPVYFNRPLGRPAGGFDESFKGVYFDLDGVTQDWLDGLGETIESQGDSAVIGEFLETLGFGEQEKDTVSVSGTEFRQGRTSRQRTETSAGDATEDSLVMSFNQSVSQIISDAASSSRQDAKYYAYVFGRTGLQLFTVDSTDIIRSNPLIQLSDTVQLTTYADRYFLNFRTPLGWEIIQVKQVTGDIVAFQAITASVSTDPSPKDLKALEASVTNTYRNLRAIVDDDGHVVGFRARLRNRQVIETFDSKEGAWLRLIRIF